jgi:hypothetical protein
LTRGILGGGPIDEEKCYLSKSQLLLRQELVIAGLEAEHMIQMMGWQVMMTSGMQQLPTGELLGGDFTHRRLELYGKAVDRAFPYMDISATIARTSGTSAEELVEQGKRIEESLKLNPGMTPEEFLTSKF